MPTVLTGVAADPGTSPQATGPASGDVIASAAMDNSALQPLLNYISWLRTHSALLDSANTFTASETFNAAVTVAALLTLNTGNVSLTAGALQSILKGGTGKLQIGTSQASDVELLVNNAVKLALVASGWIDAKTQQIINVVDPTTAQAAATKNYVDTSPAVAKAWAKLSIGAAGAVTVTKGLNVASASWSTNILTVNMASALADTNYTVNPSSSAFLGNNLLFGGPNTTSQFAIQQINSTNSALLNFVSGQIVYVVVFD